MLERISNYVNDREFRIVFYGDKVHIINYQKIISLENNYISIISNNKKLSITGSNLVLNKLLDNEMLNTGIITKLEVKDV